MKKFLFSELIKTLKLNNYIADEYSHINNFFISGFSSIKSNKPGTVAWLQEGINAEWENLKVAVLICGKKTEIPRDVKFIAVKVPNPRLAFIYLLKSFSSHVIDIGFEQTVIIGKNCKIGKNVYLGHYVVLQDNVEIGDNTLIQGNSYIYSNTVIGSDCIIHVGVTLGADGFGFERDEFGVPVKFPHVGGVFLGNNVELKSYTCINRGTLDNTEIHDNVKIDDFCHIGHNVIIKENCIIASGCSVSGNVIVGKNCWLAPRSTIKNKVTIGNNSTIGLGAVVISDVQNNDVVVGVPAKSIKERC